MELIRMANIALCGLKFIASEALLLNQAETWSRHLPANTIFNTPRIY